MEFLILFVLILLNGLFAMSEIALVTARKARLSVRAADGSKAAQAAIRLGEDPARFLSTVQIGITSIGLFSGIVGETALAGPLASWLTDQFSLHAGTASTLATAIVVAAVTYLSIVAGELVPKRIGQISPEKTACLVARPMESLALLSRPFVALLTGSTSAILRLLGIRADSPQAVTEEEIQAMLEESSEAGAIDRKQQEMVRNVFRLDDRPAASIMVPRAEVRFLDITLSPQENLGILRGHGHPWIPVCQSGLNGLLGVIPTNRALLLFTDGMPEARDFSRKLQEACAAPVFIPETLNSLELLESFQRTGAHMMFIVDEYGTVQGIATAHDLLVILAGQAFPKMQTSSWAVRNEDGSWLMDGSIPLPELKDSLGVRELPDEGKGHYSILSGMLMYLTGRVPRQGERISWEDWRFEILAMDGNRIDKVRAEKPEKAPTPEA